MNITSELHNHIFAHCEENNIAIDCRFAWFADKNEFWSHDIPFSTDCVSYEIDKCEDVRQFIIDYVDILWEHCTPPCNRIAFYLENIIDMGDWYEVTMGGALFEEV